MRSNFALVAGVAVVFFAAGIGAGMQFPAVAPATVEPPTLQEEVDRNSKTSMLNHFAITDMAGMDGRIGDVGKDVDVCHQRIDDLITALKVSVPERKRPDR